MHSQSSHLVLINRILFLRLLHSQTSNHFSRACRKKIRQTLTQTCILNRASRTFLKTSFLSRASQHNQNDQAHRNVGIFLRRRSLALQTGRHHAPRVRRPTLALALAKTRSRSQFKNTLGSPWLNRKDQ